jgi:hypothetical protein
MMRWGRFKWAGAAIAAVAVLFGAGFVVLKDRPISGAANDLDLCGRCHVMGLTIRSFGAPTHRDLNRDGCRTAHGFLTGPFSGIGLGAENISLLATGLKPYGLLPQEREAG